MQVRWRALSSYADVTGHDGPVTTAYQRPRRALKHPTASHTSADIHCRRTAQIAQRTRLALSAVLAHGLASPSCAGAACGGQPVPPGDRVCRSEHPYRATGSDAVNPGRHCSGSRAGPPGTRPFAGHLRKSHQIVPTDAVTALSKTDCQCGQHSAFHPPVVLYVHV